MRLSLVTLGLSSASGAYLCGGGAHAAQQSRAAVSMGLLDGVKGAFQGGDKPPVAADRVTPFDRWMGLDKALIEADKPDESAAYIDPNDPANYFSIELPKPMGIAFVENDGECGGLYVSELLTEGSACSTNAPLQKGDQLVGVDASLVLGSDLDATLDKIRDSETATTKLTMFRGPTAFLYGPTAPSAEWYQEKVL